MSACNNNTQLKKIVFITPYPFGVAPSQRFRFEQYLEFLKENGYEIRFESFLTHKGWSLIYQKGKLWSKIYNTLKGFLKRFVLLFKIRKANIVFVHREATPLGFPIVEWIIAKILRKKIICDFDDAIWMYPSKNPLIRLVKCPQKTKAIIKWSAQTSCGNEYLANYAKSINPNVKIIPTTVDTDHHHNILKKKNNEKLVIGWTGTHSTMKYLQKIVPTIKKIQQEIDVNFLVISNQKPDLPISHLIYKKWNQTTEIEDLLLMDIGIMPLDNTEWEKGKCGFKAIQYMALGVPALVSPVGVNTKIVDHGIDGFICENESEWYNYTKKLLLDRKMRAEMGIKARKKILANYSVKSTKAAFLNLFKNIEE